MRVEVKNGGFRAEDMVLLFIHNKGKVILATWVMKHEADALRKELNKYFYTPPVKDSPTKIRRKKRYV